MPIPLILAGLGAVAAVAGIGGHMEAKETNEKANKISRDAQKIYDNAKNSLEKAQNNAKNSLEVLERNQNKIANTSIKVFMDAFVHIRLDKVNVSDFNRFEGVNLDESFLLELRQLQGVYSSSLSKGVAGAAVGSAIAIASSGMLPIISSTLSLAAGALSFGGIGAATTLAGSALSMAASATPLAAIAAPVMLFTAFSANDKADENLEKAKTNYAEVEAAVAQMSTSETMCNAIVNHAKLFNDILTQLDSYLSPLTELFSRVVSVRCEELGRDQLDPLNDFNESELKIMAAAHSILQSIISFFKVDFLDSEGQLSIKFEQIYDAETKMLPRYSKESDPDTIAAEANHMLQESSSTLCKLNVQVRERLEMLRNVSSDNETNSEIKQVMGFISDIVDNANRKSSVKYYGGSYSANDAFMAASKQSREINDVSLVLETVSKLVNAKINQYNSYAKYCNVRESIISLLSHINSLRKKFVDDHVLNLLKSYQLLNGFMPYGLSNYINSDMAIYKDMALKIPDYNIIHFSIIPDSSNSANQMASKVNNYCNEINSTTRNLDSLSCLLKEYEDLLNSASVDAFIKVSLKVERMISEKASILGTSKLSPINFTKKEKALLSFSLQTYEHIKNIFSFELNNSDVSVNHNTYHAFNRIKNESANIIYGYTRFSATDYAQNAFKAQINTFHGNIIVLTAFTIIALFVLFLLSSIVPKFISVIIIFLIIAGCVTGGVNIKSRCCCNLQAVVV